jgi:hypothetical protein
LRSEPGSNAATAASAIASFERRWFSAGIASRSATDAAKKASPSRICPAMQRICPRWKRMSVRRTRSSASIAARSASASSATFRRLSAKPTLKLLA